MAASRTLRGVPANRTAEISMFVSRVAELTSFGYAESER